MKSHRMLVDFLLNGNNPDQWLSTFSSWRSTKQNKIKTCKPYGTKIRFWRQSNDSGPKVSRDPSVNLHLLQNESLK